MTCSNSVHNSVVMATAPSKTLECNDSVYSSVVKDISPSEIMECDDNLHNSCVHTKVSVVPFLYEIFKTGNSYSSDNVDTLKLVQSDSNTFETANSVQNGKFMDQEIHCKLHSCCNSFTFCVCGGLLRKKERSKPHSDKKK